MYLCCCGELVCFHSTFHTHPLYVHLLVIASLIMKQKPFLFFVWLKQVPKKISAVIFMAITINHQFYYNAIKNTIHDIFIIKYIMFTLTVDCVSIRIYYENLVVSINNEEPNGNNKITK